MTSQYMKSLPATGRAASATAAVVRQHLVAEVEAQHARDRVRLRAAR